MVSTRRPKRKAAQAALDIIKRACIAEDEKEEEDVVLGQRSIVGSGQLFVSLLEDGISVPEEVSYSILAFLPQVELVHSVSFVSTDWWYFVNRSPSKLWETLDFSSHSSCPTAQCISSMRRFLELLERPQFRAAKTLVPPSVYRTLHRNILPRIAEACPRLESLSLEGTSRGMSLRPFEDEMPEIPRLFPHLVKLSLCMRFMPRDTVIDFLHAMQGRLVHLDLFSVREIYVKDKNYCTNATLETMGRLLPQLESFQYGFKFGSLDDDLEDTVTDEGIISLLQNCPKLKRLELRVENIGPKLYEYILQHSQDLQLSSLIVHGHSPVKRLTAQVRQQLAATLETFDLHQYY